MIGGTIARLLLSVFILLIFALLGASYLTLLPSIAPIPPEIQNGQTLKHFHGFIHRLLSHKSPFPIHGIGERRTFKFQATSFPITANEPHIPRFGVPVLNGHDLLVRLLDSLDVYIKDFVLVWSITRDSEGLRWARSIFAVIMKKAFLHTERNVIIHVIEGNVGVAAAWNIINAPQADTPFTFICSHDINFTQGYLRNLVQYINAHSDVPIFLSRGGYPFFVLRPGLATLVGDFDENIWPAYCEDCEHINRLHLAAIAVDERLPGEYLQEWFHGFETGSSTIQASKSLKDAIQSAQKHNCEYVRKKWNFTQEQCGMKPRSPEHPTPYYHPFNNLSAPLGYWQMDWKRRAELATYFAYSVMGLYDIPRRAKAVPKLR